MNSLLKGIQGDCVKKIAVVTRNYRLGQLVANRLKNRNLNVREAMGWNLEILPRVIQWSDVILTVGGDGVVAWAVREYYQRTGTLKGLKPIVPVVKPESVGYLRQIEIMPEERFWDGIEQLLNGNYRVQNRTVLKVKWETYNIVQSNIAVNEVVVDSTPNVGRFSVNLPEGQLTEVFGDGILISTAIGSTAWSLSLGGLININEDALQIIFLGGMHGSANFIIPRTKVDVEVNVKNPAVLRETINILNETLVNEGVRPLHDAERTLKVIFSPRLILDGKILQFGVKKITIYPDLSIPMAILRTETILEKVRKITRLARIDNETPRTNEQYSYSGDKKHISRKKKFNHAKMNKVNTKREKKEF